MNNPLGHPGAGRNGRIVYTEEVAAEDRRVATTLRVAHRVGLAGDPPRPWFWVRMPAYGESRACLALLCVALLVGDRAPAHVVRVYPSVLERGTYAA